LLDDRINSGTVCAAVSSQSQPVLYRRKFYTTKGRLGSSAMHLEPLDDHIMHSNNVGADFSKPFHHHRSGNSAKDIAPRAVATARLSARTRWGT
jgi:hypothetical protein